MWWFMGGSLSGMGCGLWVVVYGWFFGWSVVDYGLSMGGSSLWVVVVVYG